MFKTSWDVMSTDRRRKTFFSALWLFNAVTSAFFGFQHLHVLFQPFAGYLPIEPATAEIFARIAGAAGALVVLDAAYLYWEHLRINDAKSAEQVDNAQLGETTSFYLSVAFTIAVLVELTLFQFVSDSFRAFVSWGSAGLFIAQSAGHLVLMRKYRQNNPAVKEAAQLAIVNGKRETERLQFHKKVHEQGVARARNHTEQYIDTIAQGYGQLWGNDAIKEIAQQLPEDSPGLLPPQNAREFSGNYPEAGRPPIIGPVLPGGLSVNRRESPGKKKGKEEKGK